MKFSFSAQGARVIAGAMLVMAPALTAQTRPDSAKKTTPAAKSVPKTVKDSAAGKLDLKADSLSMKRDSLAMKRDSLAMKRDSVAIKKDSLDMKANFGQLMTALTMLDTNTKRFTDISGLSAENIMLVDVRNILQGDNQQALDLAVGKSERQITAMRAGLQNSTVLRDLLVSRQIPMSQVVAVDVSADGKRATVFYLPTP